MCLPGMQIFKVIAVLEITEKKKKMGNNQQLNTLSYCIEDEKENFRSIFSTIILH